MTSWGPHADVHLALRTGALAPTFDPAITAYTHAYTASSAQPNDDALLVQSPAGTCVAINGEQLLGPQTQPNRAEQSLRLDGVVHIYAVDVASAHRSSCGWASGNTTYTLVLTRRHHDADATHRAQQVPTLCDGPGGHASHASSTAVQPVAGLGAPPRCSGKCEHAADMPAAAMAAIGNAEAVSDYSNAHCLSRGICVYADLVEVREQFGSRFRCAPHAPEGRTCCDAGGGQFYGYRWNQRACQSDGGRAFGEIADEGPNFQPNSPRSVLDKPKQWPADGVSTTYVVPSRTAAKEGTVSVDHARLFIEGFLACVLACVIVAVCFRGVQRAPVTTAVRARTQPTNASQGVCVGGSVSDDRLPARRCGSGAGGVERARPPGFHIDTTFGIRIGSNLKEGLVQCLQQTLQQIGPCSAITLMDVSYGISVCVTATEAVLQTLQLIAEKKYSIRGDSVRVDHVPADNAAVLPATVTMSTHSSAVAQSILGENCAGRLLTLPESEGCDSFPAVSCGVVVATALVDIRVTVGNLEQAEETVCFLYDSVDTGKLAELLQEGQLGGEFLSIQSMTVSRT